MPFSSPRFLSQSSLIRRFLTSQTLNVAVAIALFAVLWVVNWRRADFTGILLYSVVAGSMTMAAMKRIAPVFMRLSLFYHTEDRNLHRGRGGKGHHGGVVDGQPASELSGIR
jgi:hypothetical protein